MLSNIEKAYEVASQSSHPEYKVGCYFENTRTGRSIATHNVELGTKLHDIAPNGQCLEYIHAEVWASQELMRLPYELRVLGRYCWLGLGGILSMIDRGLIPP